ncbi:protein crumbs-like isoform X2 [Littorina saxatilis]|uniref:protein crumbs-like isoform X2 n=1 Tax=Littorina saxatilis TaxID=31220 RepID=UPI0038B536F7
MRGVRCFPWIVMLCALRLPGVVPADQNDCYERPCLNGGTCVDLLQSYHCECPRNFNGTDCGEDLARKIGCLVSPCENNATCENVTVVSPGDLPYRCTCPQGFTGVNCETLLNQCEKSPPPCLHGTCSSNVNSYTCNCTGTGFRGQNCSDDIDECEGSPCDSGTCYNIPGSYSCQCPLGYDGPKCQDIDECVSSPCQNGATCVQGVNNYTCSCHGGFRGHNCEENIDDCVDSTCSGQNVECRDEIMSYQCVCQPGYQNVSGVCQDIDECQSNPCQNSAICQNNVNAYNCSCVPGFTGVNCQTNIDECESQPCLNNATCVDGVNMYRCECVPGFTSSDCSNNIDECLSNLCRNGATCVDAVNNYTCTCLEGWTGDRCEKNIDDCASDPCQNNAPCNDLVANYTCTCMPGFTGDQCETNIDDCDPDPCQFEAPCTDGIDDFTCSCPPEKMGKNCSEVYDACFSMPCQNNATCNTTPPERQYMCQCVTGFEGRNCSTNIDDCVDNTCLWYQRCYDGINNYTCGCPIGYQGTNCSLELDECESDPCQNGGSCNDYIGFYNCTCPMAGIFKDFVTGYTGVNCQEDINECDYDPPICLNGGDCKNNNGSYRCFCPGQTPEGTLITGANCDIVTSYCIVSGNKACQNGATCTNGERDYICECPPGFTGKNCSTNIDECQSTPCQNNGTCEDGVNRYNCTCILGITGANCEINIDDCANDTCGPGQCTDKINDYECNCFDTGFKGDNCEINIDDCIEATCSNNATCQDGIKEYTCDCKAGYTGTDCDIDIPECVSNPCQYNGTCLEFSNQSLYGQDHPNFTEFSYSAAAGYLCECILGIEGVNCEINIEDCVEGACKNNATCEDGINEFTCTCAPGYTGTRCETEINECDLYQACQNNAVCTDFIADYTCQCVEFDANNPNKHLYGGKNCSIYLSGCVAGNGNRCQNGDCVPYLRSESPVSHDYRCVCETGFTGRYCDKSTTMTFSSNGSHVTYSPTGGLQPDSQSLSFRFRTTLSDAVLAVYTWSSNTFVSVEMVDGMVAVVYHYDSSRLPHTVATQEHLNNAEWHSAVLHLQNNISLSLLSHACGTERCVQQFSYPRSKPNSSSAGVQLGKLDSSIISQTLTNSVFVGCMEDVIFGDVYLFPGQQEGQYINSAASCPRVEQCDPYTCSRHGNCVDLWDSFRCDCDRPYWGATCQNEYTAATFSKDGMPSIAAFDVSTLSSSFSSGLDLSLFLRTRQNNSLIMYLTNGATSTNNLTYMTLEIQNSRVAARLNRCGAKMFFNQSNNPIDQGSLNFVHAKMDTDSLVLMVNRTVHINETVLSQPPCPLQASTAYFGKVPENSSGRRKRQVDVATTLAHLDPFNGVIRDIELQGHKLDFELRNATQGSEYVVMSQVLSNVTLGAESTLSVCNTSAPCQNGGTCSDVFFNDFQCECPDGYLGKDCSQPDFCKPNSCPTDSSCNSLHLGFECISTVSFNGASVITYSTSLLPDDLPSQTISFSIRTRSFYGAIFETRAPIDQNNFIKVRVRDGSLEVNYLLKASGFSSSLRMHERIDDGQWYDVEVVIDDTNAMRLRIRQNGTIIKEEPANDALDLGTTVISLADLITGGGRIQVGDVADGKEQAYVGCLRELRVGGILLPFILDNVMPNNNATPKFSATSLADVTAGCQGADDSCVDNLCRNGARCRDAWNDYECDCIGGYDGRFCQWRAAECGASTCINGAVCKEDLEGTYTCLCPPGFTGARCETGQDVCTNSTCDTNNSVCVADTSVERGYTCNCSDQDFTGADCTVNRVNKSCADNLCLNGATCENDQNSSSFSCSCVPGYTGALCDNAIDYCQGFPCNNGTCINDAARQNYTCHCSTGFTGDACEINEDDCTSTSCNNGGTCLDGLDTFNCLCPSGWTGQTCDSDIDECNRSVCQYGLCSNEPAGSYTCNCANTGYGGKNCSVEINECDHNFCVAATSSNCTDIEGSYECECKLGYTGKNCSEADCAQNPCLNGSTCDDRVTADWGTDWQCMCQEFFGGRRCNIPGPCAFHPCNASNTDSCKQDLFNTTDTNVSSNFTCVCKSGWEGDTCSQDINECNVSTPCLNGATCENKLGSYFCRCATGYTGFDCETDIDDCADQPCQNNAVCSDGLANYLCNCSQTGYTGRNCTEDIDECQPDPHPCNNGTCNNTLSSFTCDCGDTYLGARCEHVDPCSSTVCGNGGHCNWIQQGGAGYLANCTCVGGYTGLTCEQSPQSQTDDDDGINLAVIIGPIVAVILLIIIIAVIVFIVVARDKRATRGAYSPSRQETAGARVELGNVLKKPPEERLI